MRVIWRTIFDASHFVPKKHVFIKYTRSAEAPAKQSKDTLYKL